MKGKVSLYYNQITIGLQLGYNQLHHRLHRGSTQYKQFPQKKKKKRRQRRKTERKEGEGKERERKERGGKDEKEKKGWKEFIWKERKRESERWKKR